jgi:hypothetical protein
LAAREYGLGNLGGFTLAAKPNAGAGVVSLFNAADRYAVLITTAGGNTDASHAQLRQHVGRNLRRDLRR